MARVLSSHQFLPLRAVLALVYLLSAFHLAPYLRRRFHFAPFFPDREPIAGVLRRWADAQQADLTWLVDIVDEANTLIEDRHTAIGPSHFMKDGLDEEHVELVWEHSALDSKPRSIQRR